MTRRQPSLAARLARRLALVVIAAIAIAGLAVGWRSVVVVRALDDTALQDQAETLATFLSTGAAGQPVLALPPSLAAAFRASAGDNVYLITNKDGAILKASQPDAVSQLAPVPTTPGLFRLPPSAHHPAGVLGFVRSVGPWRIVVAQSREQSEALVRAVLADLLTTGLGLLAVIGSAGVLVGVWTVRQGLRPVRDASLAAAVVGPARPGARLPEADMPAEIAPLATAVNEALSRLESALAAQRRFVGEAAHTLRTPLAVLIARLDALPDTPGTRALRHDADRIARLVAQMLQMARIEGAPLDTSGIVDLHEVALKTISLLAPIAVQRGLEIELNGKRGPRIRGNHAALLVALQNLVENALTYAPHGTSIEVELTPQATLRVLDRGPGIPAQERVVIFERFRRGRSEASTEGAGLGLSIVREIAGAHGGSVCAVAREGGGAMFTLDLSTAVHVEPLAAGDHREDKILAMQPARNDDTSRMQPDQHEQQMS